MDDRAITIRRSELRHLDTSHPTEITDVRHLSSYNWIEADEPTIAVPGLPPLWSPVTGSKRVEQDSGLIYMAQNATRHPDSPVEPLFRAIYELHPDYDMNTVDVVSERNNIRKLLRFVMVDGPELEPFTIRVECVDNTMIFCRTERETTRFLGSRDFCGYGHEFEKAYTTDNISDSTGHHRVISYKFGGLHFIICHETDAYVGDTSTEQPAVEPSEKPDKATTTPDSKLRVFRAGETVPIESTLEIKTRAARRPLHIDDVAPQLWVSQTPNLVRAYHTAGLFSEPRFENVAEPVRNWERVNKAELARLGGLIRWIASAVREVGGRATVRYSVGYSLLEVKGCPVETKLLPEDLYAKWGKGDRSEG